MHCFPRSSATDSPSIMHRSRASLLAMSRRYDSRTTIFSPEGRLYQVEYAMEAISHAGTALGVLASDGVVLAAEKKMSSKLLEPAKSSEKMCVALQGGAAATFSHGHAKHNASRHCRASAQSGWQRPRSQVYDRRPRCVRCCWHHGRCQHSN
eukprot:scaffold239142_cov35-Tisochrysis_lutea.AAC.2